MMATTYCVWKPGLDRTVCVLPANAEPDKDAWSWKVWPNVISGGLEIILLMIAISALLSLPNHNFDGMLFA